MRSILIALMTLSVPAHASTWLNEGTVVPLNAEVVIGFKGATRCELKPDDATVHSVHINVNLPTITVYVLHQDGSIEALQNMFGERFALDYCWQ